MGAKISRELYRSENNNDFDGDYDHKNVRKLIRTGRLAPMYKGKENGSGMIPII